MASNKVDLNINIKESIGEYYPTIYIDFLDISYGRLPDWGAPADAEAPEMEYARYSTDRDNGTHINGSLSIYFTRDKDEPKEELEKWFKDNFRNLYVYTFLCPFDELNAKVEKGTLNTRELFDSILMEDPNTFSSDSPAYDTVIPEMKEAFMTHSEYWSNRLAGESGGTTKPDSDEWTLEYMMRNIDTPGTPVYNRFWGPVGSTGPWPGAVWTAPGPSINAVGFVQARLMWFLGALHGGYLGDSGTEVNTSGTRLQRHRLSELVADDASNLRLEGMFDQDGDQIAAVVNIPVDFLINGERTLPILNNRKTIYLMSAVGLDVFQTSFYTSGNPQKLSNRAMNMNNTMFNACFGDISYIKIFESGDYDVAIKDLPIADQTEDIFVLMSDNAPLSDNPIMSINGTYHKSGPITYDSVISSLRTLIAKYSPYTDEDRALRDNIATFASIMGSQQYTIDILRRLQFFRKTYLDKSTASNSGKLYEEFKQMLYSLNRQVMIQPRARKIKVTNNKIIDSRFSAERMSYVPTFGDGNCTSGEMAGSGCKIWASMRGAGKDDCAYIPKNWHYMTRRTVFTIPIDGRGLASEVAQYLLEEGLPTMTTWGGDESLLTSSMIWNAGFAGSSAQDGPTADHAQEEVIRIWASYFASFTDGRMIGMGFKDDDMGEEASRKENVVGMIAGEEGGQRGYSSTPYQDTVVENKGVFFFDYEKALNTHSQLSFVLTPWKIQRYLGRHVPYEYFRVTKVELRRKEAQFLTHMTAQAEPDEQVGSAPPLEFVTIKQELTFDNDLPYPMPKQSVYSGFLDSDNGNQTYYRYGQPSVRLAGKTLPDGINSFDGDISFINNYAQDATYEQVMGNTLATKDTTYLMSDAGLGAGSDQATPEEEFQLAALLAMYQKTVPTNNTQENHSYLTMINFDTPLGCRNGKWNNVPKATPLSRPSGRLEDYEGWKIRGGYRMMCFEYRDYMDDDVAYYNTIGISDWVDNLTVGAAASDLEHSYAEALAHNRQNYPTNYEVKITVKDQSLKMMADIYQIFDDAYYSFVTDYYNLAMASCSYNNINDQFNDFFINGVKNTYVSSETRQWIKAPYMLNLGRQLFFGTFNTEEFATEGDNTEDVFNGIVQRSAQLSKMIGPDDGRMIHLKKFKTDFEKFLNIIRPRLGADASETTAAGQRLFGSKGGAHPGGNEFEEPFFNYHPVYQRILAVGEQSKVEDENWSDDEVVSTMWSDAINNTQYHYFENIFAINEPIYGDMFISNNYAWNYTPPTFDGDFIHPDLLEWLANLPLILNPREVLKREAEDAGPSFTADLPPYMTGLEEPLVATDKGWSSSRMHTQGFVGPSANQCSFPGRNKSMTSLSTGTGEYMGWVRQLMIACFFYRFGPFLAASLGVQFTPWAYRNEPWENFEETAVTHEESGTYMPTMTSEFFRGDTYDEDLVDMGETTNAGRADGTDHPLMDRKLYLADYTINEILDHLENTLLEEMGGSDSLGRELAGLTLLRTGAFYYEQVPGSPSDTMRFGMLFQPKPGHKIWSSGFLWALQHKMCPEIWTKRITVYGDVEQFDDIEAAFGGGAGSDFYRYDKWYYQKPAVTYMDIREKQKSDGTYYWDWVGGEDYSNPLTDAGSGFLSGVHFGKADDRAVDWKQVHPYRMVTTAFARSHTAEEMGPPTCAGWQFSTLWNIPAGSTRDWYRDTYGNPSFQNPPNGVFPNPEWFGTRGPDEHGGRYPHNMVYPEKIEDDYWGGIVSVYGEEMHIGDYLELLASSMGVGREEAEDYIVAIEEMLGGDGSSFAEWFVDRALDEGMDPSILEDCVIASDARKNNIEGFEDVHHRAIKWCVKYFHGRWYGEAWRRGYQYYGKKAIDEGRASSHYEEFRAAVDFATGEKFSFRGLFSFVRRSIQFFLKGLFIKEEK